MTLKNHRADGHLSSGNYHQGLFKTTLPISFQFHHAQMDGFEAARFLNGLQEVINKLF